MCFTVFDGLTQHYRGDDRGIEAYSQRALARISKQKRHAPTNGSLPATSEFRTIAGRLDPDGAFSSSLARRLGIVRPSAGGTAHE